MTSETITINTANSEVDAPALRERIAQFVESWANCSCDGFCECYGKSNFEEVANYIRQHQFDKRAY